MVEESDCVVVEDVFIEFIQIIVVIDILKEDISESLLIGLAHNGVPPLNTASMICVFSCHAKKADSHKIWAHEIITMLLTLYPDDEVVRYYAGAVLTSTGNFMGKRLVESEYVEPTAMDMSFADETT